MNEQRCWFAGHALVSRSFSLDILSFVPVMGSSCHSLVFCSFFHRPSIHFSHLLSSFDHPSLIVLISRDFPILRALTSPTDTIDANLLLDLLQSAFPLGVGGCALLCTITRNSP